ncbi:hypothetical protein A2783_04190 [Microgenomates group bacterium RIFCSPHIGHO2_01_FULL_45_11]|nr:MAG: hypothetical protein A2783_04190 [Microgenomates group bacterium RIFCSPHIGHO2_01_FULL_45_11]
MQTIQTTVKNKDQTLYQGKVISLSSVNDKGQFDVLPEHSNFISLIKDKLVIREPGKVPQEIKLNQAIMRVLSGKVEIYIGIGEALKEAGRLDVDEIEEFQ